MSNEDAHTWARGMLLQSFSALLPGAEIAIATLQCIGAVACHETFYGKSWAGVMHLSNNIGAVQCHATQDLHGNCPPGCAPATDSHADGKRYGACFRTYASPADGFLDFVKWFASKPDVITAAESGDVGLFVTAMHTHHYFEGFGNPEQAIEGYDKAVITAAAELASALGEPLCLQAHDVPWGSPHV